MSKNVTRVNNEKELVFRRCIRELDKGAQGVRVGVVEPAASQVHSNSDLTMAELMLIHELGLGVPQRQLVRPMGEDLEKILRPAYRKAADYIMTQVVRRGRRDEKKIVAESLEFLVREMNAGATRWVQANNVEGPPKKDQGNTINPALLVNTGELASSIGARIDKGPRDNQ